MRGSVLTVTGYLLNLLNLTYDIVRKSTCVGDINYLHLIRIKLRVFVDCDFSQIDFLISAFKKIFYRMNQDLID